MSTPRLLVIDDEPALGGFVAHVGRSAGYDVAVAFDAARFRNLYLEAEPDLIALDLGMPHDDGKEILRFLAERECRAPVVIISGFPRPVLEDTRRYGEALGLNMLPPKSKPVRLEELRQLFQAIKEDLGLRRVSHR